METKLTGKLLLVVLLLAALPVTGQTSFYRVFSGNGYDKGEGACQLPDSSFLITGTSSSFEEAPSQVFLMHIDSAGTFLWSKAYGGSESEEGKRVMAVPGYGYYVAGTSSSSGSGDFDNYLFFTDESGDQQWQVFTDNGGWERIHDAELLPDTTIFTVGETDSNTTSNPDVFLVRYSKTGAVLWSNQLGSDHEDIAYACERASDTTVLVAGTYYVADSLQNKGWLAMIRISDGSVLWQKMYGVKGDYQFNDVSLFNGQVKAVGERVETGQSEHDTYDVITDIADGNLLLSEESLQPGDNRIVSCVQYQPGPNGKFFIGMQTINPFTPTFEDGEDAQIHRYTEYLYWDNYGTSYSGVGQDQFNQMIRTSDGFALAVGFHTTYGPGGNSVMVVKIGDDQYFPPLTTNVVYDILNLEELTVLKDIRVYPNPVNEQLFVHVPGESFTYVLADATGKQLSAGAAYGDEVIDFSGQRAGFYFLQVRHESGETALMKIVK